MKHNVSKRVLSLFLALMMLFGVMPIAAFAEETEQAEPFALFNEGVENNQRTVGSTALLSIKSAFFDLSKSGCNYYNLIEKNEYALAPGATEYEIILNNNDATARNVLHVIEVDLTNDNISVMPTYFGIEEGKDLENPVNWGVQELTKQAAHVESLGYNVVGGVNTNLRYESNHPYGVLVWNGVVYSDERNANGNSTAQTFLSVTKEGVASLHSASEPIPEDSYNAISANFGWIIKNGVNQYAADDHADANRAPRTVLGITAEGKLILLMNDGRQLPYSAGSSMRELAEWLLAFGCVDAVNCDGGGSSTFITEREGTGKLTMKSSPSDGGERATLGGLLVISKAVADGKFHHASVETEDHYVTPGSEVTFIATGADSAGGPAEIPADAEWQLADPSMGTIENGIFVSNGTVGTAVAQLVYGGEVVGEASVEVVVPENIFFAQENITVPYNKTAELEIKATVNGGINEVRVKAADFVVTLSDEKLGSINGLSYTTCDEDSGISTGVVSAVLVYDETVTASASINLGKGSEIVWDFEDGDISGLTFESGYQSKHADHPELGRFEFGEMKVVDSTTGKVRNGKNALALICNYSDFYAMGYQMLKLSGLNIDLTDAVRVGFWMYIDPEQTGLELDFENWYEFNHGDAGTLYPEANWYYISVDATQISKSTFNNLYFYHTDGYDEAKENIPNVKSRFTVYIDDITVDYSTVVEDREAPEFKTVGLLRDGDMYDEMDGQTATSNIITIMAEAKENTAKNNYTGINSSSARVYVDGVQLNSGYTCSSTGVISVNNIELDDGIHTFVFEIEDNAGNTGKTTRQVVINTAEGPVRFVPADPTLTNLPIGSVYYMNLEADNAEEIQEVDFYLNLDGMSVWELDHMEVLPGFTAEYTIDEDNNDAHIVITRTGKAVATGEAVLASLPIRTWEYTNHIDYPDCLVDGKGCEMVNTPSTMWKGDGGSCIAIVVNVEKGVVKFIDETETTFSSENYSIVTELNKHRGNYTQVEKDAKNSWHIHIEGEPQDKEATCVSSGYTGRTFCIGCACGNTAENPCDTFDGCGSVVNWGTTLEAEGHEYVVVDGKLICKECKEEYNLEGINGIVTTGEKVYYAMVGSLKSGWIVDGEYYYYFSPSDFAAVDGVQVIGSYTYTFENNVLIEGHWIENENGKAYNWAGDWVVGKWATYKGEKYYFNLKGYALTGLSQAVKPTGGLKANLLFTEDGVWLENVSGIYKAEDGGIYYLDCGEATYAGVVQDENGNYYYITSSLTAYTNGSRTIRGDLTNGLLSPHYIYEFDENGVILNPRDPNGNLIGGEKPEEPTPDPKPEVKQGVHRDEDGNVRYYVDGKATYAGVVQDEDGNYYYITSSLTAYTNGSRTIRGDLTNGLLSPHYIYKFDENGVILNPVPMK